MPAFVDQMNRQAEALGLTNTSYANPSGLDAPQNYSSAADLAELVEPAAREQALRPGRRHASRHHSAAATAPARSTTRNTLLNSDPTADGIKTGHTIGAGYVLVGSATRNGTRLISVVLGARQRGGSRR